MLAELLNQSVGRVGTPWAVSVPGELFFPLFWALVCAALRETFLQCVARPFVRFQQKRSGVMCDAETQRKFLDSSYKCAFYTITWTWALILVVRSGHYSDVAALPQILWSDLPQATNWGVYMLYSFQLGFYLYCTYLAIFVDFRRSDFALLLAHHATTAILIVFSWAYSWHRSGLLVLFFMDICDVLLEASKIAYYNEWKSVTTSLFALLVAAWACFRIWGYWWYLLHPGNQYMFDIVSVQLNYATGEYTVFTFAMAFMWWMQIYWAFDLLKILIALVVLGDAEDHREEATNRLADTADARA